MWSAYDYEIRYKPGDNHGNADGLSHLPVLSYTTKVPIPADVFLLLNWLDSTPVSATQIRKWTDTDPVLSPVRQYLGQV